MSDHSEQSGFKSPSRHVVVLGPSIATAGLHLCHAQPARNKNVAACGIKSIGPATIERCSYSPKQQQNNQDNHYETKTSARAIAL